MKFKNFEQDKYLIHISDDCNLFIFFYLYIVKLSSY